MKSRVYLLFTVLGITWGSLWLVSGGVLDPVPLLCEGVLRYGAASLALGVYAAARRGKRAGQEEFSFGSGVLMGLVLLAVPYALTAWASGTVHPYLHETTTGLPAVAYGATPLIVMLMLREDAGRYLARLLVGLTGVTLLVEQGVGLEAARWSGELALVLGVLVYSFALAYAFALVHAAGSFGKEKCGQFGLVGWCAIQYATAAVVLGLIAVANGDWVRFAAGAATVEVGSWLGLAIAAGVSAVTLPLLYWVLKELGPIAAAALQWLVTLTGVLEVAIFLSPTWGWENWAGLAMTLTALCWVLRPKQISGNALLAR